MLEKANDQGDEIGGSVPKELSTPEVRSAAKIVIDALRKSRFTEEQIDNMNGVTDEELLSDLDLIQNYAHDIRYWSGIVSNTDNSKDRSSDMNNEVTPALANLLETYFGLNKKED